MRLIREVTESVNLITESKLGKGKEYFIEGVFLQSELKNRNGSIYPESIMDKEVGRYLKEYVEKQIEIYSKLKERTQEEKYFQGMVDALQEVLVKIEE